MLMFLVFLTIALKVPDVSLQTINCASTFGFDGTCQFVSDCKGGAFVSINCTKTQICCVRDPEENVPVPNGPTYVQFSLKLFLNLATDTLRTRALYPLFAKALDDSKINSCHSAAVFFSQLAGETKLFTEFESDKSGKDFDSLIGNDQVGDGSKYRGRGAIHLRGKSVYQVANSKIKGLNMDLVTDPESAAFPHTAFKIASWFWNENAYIILNSGKAVKGSLSSLVDGTLHNFTILSHSLTNNLEFLNQRTKLYAKAVDELNCDKIKRGRGIDCEIGKEKGYAVPICFSDFNRPYCGCDGKFSRGCPYGFSAQGQCRSSSIVQCCIEQCRRGLDFLVIMDASGSMSPPQYKKQKNFVKDFVAKLEIGADATRFAIIKFSTDVEIVANFTSFTNKDALFKAIDEMDHPAGTTSTASALNIANKIVLQESNGMRPVEKGVPKIVLVMTDGKSNEAPELTIPTADGIKKRGINIISLGIGKEIDREELIGISSSPNDVYTLENFDKFGLIIETLTKTACQQPAQINFQKEVNSELGKDEYKFFKFNLPEASDSNLFLEIENIKGENKLYYSFEDENPKDPNECIVPESTDNNENFFERNHKQSSNSLILPNNGTKIVYIGVKGLENKNEFKIGVNNFTKFETSNTVLVSTSQITTTAEMATIGATSATTIETTSNSPIESTKETTTMEISTPSSFTKTTSNSGQKRFLREFSVFGVVISIFWIIF